MLEKIKDFFSKKSVRIISWIVFAISVVALVVGGATLETVQGGAVLVAAIISAVSALIAFIAEQIKK